MFSGQQPQGFTIIETLIFLAVTGILFVSAVDLISGRQNQTEFTTGVHEVFSQLQSLSSNTQVGYYTNTNNFNCSTAAGSLAIASGANPQGEGANFGCIFLGRVIQFAPQVNNGTPDNQQYNVYTVVGRQFLPAPNNGTLTDNLTQATPTVVPADFGYLTYTLPPGLTIDSVSYKDANSAPNYNYLTGFFSNFPRESGSSILSGSENSILIPVPYNPSPTLQTSNTTIANAMSAINSMSDNSGTTTTVINTSNNGATPTIEDPSDGVEVCLKSTSLHDVTYAMITIGGNGAGNVSGNPLSLQLTMGSVCPVWP